ncbi:MAG TPA: hypothetical protein VFO65_02755 [Acidimicrobiales bacterium]|nr:hypothetical protein [Acidimicrobiales bacterium]
MTRVLVATEEGTEGLGGRPVGPLATAAGGEVWAVVGERELWRRPPGGSWEEVAVGGHDLTCVQPLGTGVVVGTAEAHLLELDGDGRHLETVASFDAVADRAKWYTPWGGPADTRSIAASGDVLLVNIHVGGVARSDDGPRGPWRALVDIDVDVHQVIAAPDGSLLVATGAAGFGRSTDGGETWAWDHEGLHGSYCRAVAVAGDHVLLSASTGPHTTRGAVYRRPLGSAGGWERVGGLVPGNVDTFWLAAAGDTAAFATEAGAVWASADAGATWDLVRQVGGRPRGLALV